MHHRTGPPPGPQPHFEGAATLNIYARSRTGKPLARDERAWLESLPQQQTDMLAQMYGMRRDRERLARRVLMAGGTVVNVETFGRERTTTVRHGKTDAQPHSAAPMPDRRTGARSRESHPRRSRRAVAATGGSSDPEPPEPPLRRRHLRGVGS